MITPTGDPARWSRYARTVMTHDWMLPAERHDEALADRLVEFGKRQAAPPVLFYCSDQSMVFGGVWRWDDPGPLLGMAAVRLRSAALRSSSAVDVG